MCKESHGVGQIAQRESKQDKQNLFFFVYIGLLLFSRIWIPKQCVSWCKSSGALHLFTFLATNMAKTK